MWLYFCCCCCWYSFRHYSIRSIIDIDTFSMYYLFFFSWGHFIFSRFLFFFIYFFFFLLFQRPHDTMFIKSISETWKNVSLFDSMMIKNCMFFTGYYSFNFSNINRLVVFEKVAAPTTLAKIIIYYLSFKYQRKNKTEICLKWVKICKTFITEV